MYVPISPDVLHSVAQVEVKIKGFRKRFNAIKESTIRCLERCCITVMTAVFVLTSIRAVDEHRVFLEEKHKSLFECKHLLELFSLLNLYWNYLAYNLLDQFIEELTLKDDCFESVAGEMAEYKKDMQDFRKSTTLELFCQAQSERTGNDPPPGFKKIIVKHNWPQTVTLEYVEKFRQCFGCEYNLQKCAMMLHSIRTGSITVIWFVPDNVVEIVKMHEPQDVYRKFKVSRLEIADNCVYQSHQVSCEMARAIHCNSQANIAIHHYAQLCSHTGTTFSFLFSWQLVHWKLFCCGVCNTPGEFSVVKWSEPYSLIHKLYTTMHNYTGTTFSFLFSWQLVHWNLFCCRVCNVHRDYVVPLLCPSSSTIPLPFFPPPPPCPPSITPLHSSSLLLLVLSHSLPPSPLLLPPLPLD